MALHPMIQKKCQDEVDEKIGSRPPTIEVHNLRKISFGTPSKYKWGLGAQKLQELPFYEWVILEDTTYLRS